MNDLHHWRVGVKKVRAIQQILDYYHPVDESLQQVEAIKLLFHRSGKIRQHYLNLKLLGKYGYDQTEGPEIDHVLDPDIRKICNRPSKNVKVIRHYTDYLSGKTHDLKDSAVRDYYRTKVKKINRLLRESSGSDKLHQSRKSIKNLMYLYSVLPRKLQNKLGLNIPYFEDTADSIGKWHDASLALQELLKRKLIGDVARDRFEYLCAQLLEDATLKTRRFKRKARLHPAK